MTSFIDPVCPSSNATDSNHEFWYPPPTKCPGLAHARRGSAEPVSSGHGASAQETALAVFIALHPPADVFGRQQIFVIFLHLGFDSQVITHAYRKAGLLSNDLEISSLGAGCAVSREGPGMPMRRICSWLGGARCLKNWLPERVLLGRTQGPPGPGLGLYSLPAFLHQGETPGRVSPSRTSGPHPHPCPIRRL